MCDNNDESLESLIEELEALKRHKESLRKRREEQDKNRQELESLLSVRRIEKKIADSSELSEEIVNSESFKERFCRIYQKNTVQTASDIAPIIVGLLSELGILTAAFSILKIIAKRILDEYCQDIDN